MSERRTAGLAGCLLSAAGPPKARRSFFRSGRDVGGRNRLAGTAGGHPCAGSRASRRAELERVRADAAKMSVDFRAELAAELAQVRADLRARAACAARGAAASPEGLAPL